MGGVYWEPNGNVTASPTVWTNQTSCQSTQSVPLQASPSRVSRTPFDWQVLGFRPIWDLSEHLVLPVCVLYPCQCHLRWAERGWWNCCASVLHFLVSGQTYAINVNRCHYCSQPSSLRNILCLYFWGEIQFRCLQHVYSTTLKY